MIQEKALRLAEYDGWKLKDKKYNGYLKIIGGKEWKGKIETDLIALYSSFDKLMELFDKANKADNDYFIRIDCYGVELFQSFCDTSEETIDCYVDDERYTLKEALMDCLLEYYKQTKGV